MILTHRLAVIVPSTVNVNVPNMELHRKMVSLAMATMSAKYGGATAIPAQGGYMAENGDLVTESVTIVQSWTTQENATGETVRELAERICEEMSQECVGIEWDGQFELVNRRALRLAA